VVILDVADFVSDRFNCFSVKYWSSIRWLSIFHADDVACQDNYAEKIEIDKK
jgi:hypothetical protein